MTNQTVKRRWAFLFAVITVFALAISAGVYSAKRQQPKKQTTYTPVTSMPQVYSKVKTMEIVRTWIVSHVGPSGHVAHLEVRNNTDKDVIGLDLVCGDGAKTSWGLTDLGPTGKERQHPLVKARETLELQMPFTNMTFGAPLVVSAVIYADDTGDGDEESLKIMRTRRAESWAEYRAKKEKAEKEKEAKKEKP